MSWNHPPQKRTDQVISVNLYIRKENLFHGTALRIDCFQLLVSALSETKNRSHGKNQGTFAMFGKRNEPLGVLFYSLWPWFFSPFRPNTHMKKTFASMIFKNSAKQLFVMFSDKVHVGQFIHHWHQPWKTNCIICQTSSYKVSFSCFSAKIRLISIIVWNIHEYALLRKHFVQQLWVVY